MKITGIGNAIVDVICKVEEDFLEKNKLNKNENYRNWKRDSRCYL